MHSAYFRARSSTVGYLQRIEVGSNFLFSAFGSLLYLIGIALFIPEENNIVLGTQIFIYGSVVIFLSQFWNARAQLYEADGGRGSQLGSYSTARGEGDGDEGSRARRRPSR